MESHRRTTNGVFEALKILSDFVTSKDEVIKSKAWSDLRSACLEFEHKFNIRLWTVVEENCLETPTKLMTDDLYELLIKDGKNIKKIVEDLEK